MKNSTKRNIIKGATLVVAAIAFFGLFGVAPEPSWQLPYTASCCGILWVCSAVFTKIEKLEKEER